MVSELRHQVGKWLFWLGWRIQPERVRRGLGFIVGIGHQWAENNEADLMKVISGKPFNAFYSITVTSPENDA